MGSLELTALAWVLTYLMHSTVLLAAAWWASRLLRERRGTRELVWSWAALGAVLTASAQVGLGFEPLGGRLTLGPAAVAAHPEADPPTRDPLRWEVREVLLVCGEAPGTLATQAWPTAFRSPEDPDPTAGRSGVPAAPAGRAPSTAAADRARVLGAPSPGAAREEEPTAASPTATGTVGHGRLRDRLRTWLALATPRAALGLLAGPAALALLPLLLGWLSLRRALRGGRDLTAGPLAQQWSALVARAGLERAPRLVLCPGLDAPLTAGLLRPRVCLPERALSLAPGARTALLAHELAHAERRDPRRALLLAVLERVLWFQPLNRRARRELEDLAEVACDARAVELGARPLELARCLTEVAAWLVAQPRRARAAPGMAVRSSLLSTRVRRLAGYAPAPQREPRRALACSAAGAALLAVLAALPGAWAGPRAAESPVPGVPAAPARPEVPAAPAALDPSPRALPRPAAAPIDELGALLEVLDHELGQLEGELAALGRAARADLGADLGAEVAELEGRLAALRASRARLAASLPLLQARAAGLPRAPLARAIPVPIPVPIPPDVSFPDPRHGEESR